MTRNRLVMALIALVLAMLTTTAYCQTPNDVPQGHWAYDAVQSLATKGMIKGYPPSGNFFGGRTVSRYEMAVIIQRVLAQVDQAIAAIPEPKVPTPEVTKADLDEVRKLVDEFKVELTVIGADLQKVKDELDSVKTDVASIKDTVNKQAGDIAAAKADAAAAKADAKKAADAAKKTDAAIDKVAAGKVDAGFGKIKVDGLLQAWISAPQHSNPVATGSIDTFKLRRAQLLFTGNVNPKTYWGLTWDAAAASTPLNTQLLDMYLGYNLRPNVAFQVGQMKLPLSMEGLRSSSQQYFVMRSIFNEAIPNGKPGRFGNTYDVGAMVKYSSKSTDAQLGVFDDGGAKQSTSDDNNAKEVMWHGQYKGIPYLTLGGYQSISGGVNGWFRTLRHRAGAEMALAYGRNKLEAEWVIARDGLLNTAGTAVTNPNQRSHGGYAAYLYRLNPTWEFATRGEFWNPNRDLHGAALNTEYDLTLGINYYLTGNNAKIQFNWIRKNINGPLSADGKGMSALSDLGIDRNMFMVNFQQAF